MTLHASSATTGPQVAGSSAAGPQTAGSQAAGSQAASSASLSSALAALRSVLARLGAERDLAQLYEAAITEAQAFLDAEQVALLLVDSRSWKWRVPCRPIGMRDDQVAALTAYLDSRSPVLAEEWAEPGVLRLRDPGCAPLFDADLMQVLNEEDVLLARMEAEGRPLGILRVANRRDGRLFSDDEVHLLGFLASQSALMIHSLAVAQENARLFDQTQRLLERAERRSRELALLNQVTAAISSALDLDDVLDLMLEQLRRLFHFDRASIALLDGQRLRILGAIGFPEGATIAGRSFAADQFPLNREVLAGRRPVLVPDVTQDPRWIRTAGNRARAWLGVPLVYEGESIGILTITALQPRSYSSEEQQLVEALAKHAALAIVKAQIFVDARRRAMQLETIQEVTRRITAILDPEQLLLEVADLLAQRFGYYHVHVFLADETDRYLAASGGNGEVGRKLVESGLRLAIGEEGICGWAAGIGETVVVNDVSQEPRYFHNALLANVRSEMAVPMKLRGRVIGLLNVESDRTGAFDDNDRFLMETLADQVAIALENARLFNTSRERTRELARAIDELKALDRMKDEFVQTVSHELRTPLTFVKGYTDLLLEGDLGELGAEQANALNVMADRTEDIIRLVNDIIALTRAEPAQLKLAPQDLARIAMGCAASAQAVTDHAGIVIETDFEPALPRVLGDAQRLAQVFDNLLGNAIKFSPDGGTIWVRLAARDSVVAAQVSDHGIGIPARHLDRVWDRFYQVDGTTTRRFGGTGLGLAIVKRLVEAHDGQVGVQSVEGEGSTFWFTIPIAP